LELINQLLDFRKLEMGGESLKLHQADIVEFVRYIGSGFKELATNRSIKFSIESECPGMNIWFDDTKMQRILNNIYSNAFKFTPDGGLISTIVATEKKDEKIFVRIEISDTGCGISEKDLNVIFDRFYQSEPIPGVTGSGIGLHMVKEYVSLHNGKIEVHSKIGVGTTFLIYIPSDLKGDDSESKAPAMSPDVEEKVVYSDRKTILIVEDNVEFRRFLVEQLIGQFNILEAGDGAEGEEVAIHKSPDLIISDMMMPKVDGLEMYSSCEPQHNVSDFLSSVVKSTDDYTAEKTNGRWG
jgi:CheY-like chemotaxis protein